MSQLYDFEPTSKTEYVYYNSNITQHLGKATKQRFFREELYDYDYELEAHIRTWSKTIVQISFIFDPLSMVRVNFYKELNPWITYSKGNHLAKNLTKTTRENILFRQIGFSINKSLGKDTILGNLLQGANLLVMFYSLANDLQLDFDFFVRTNTLFNKRCTKDGHVMLKRYFTLITKYELEECFIGMLYECGYCDIAYDLAIGLCKRSTDWAKLSRICNIFKNRHKRILELVNEVAFNTLGNSLIDNWDKDCTNKLRSLVLLFVTTNTYVVASSWYKMQQHSFVIVNKRIIWMLTLLLVPSTNGEQLWKNLNIENPSTYQMCRLIRCPKDNLRVTEPIFKLLVVSCMWSHETNKWDDTLFRMMDSIIMDYHDFSGTDRNNFLNEPKQSRRTGPIILNGRIDFISYLLSRDPIEQIHIESQSRIKTKLGVLLIKECYKRYVNLSNQPSFNTMGGLTDFDVFVKCLASYLNLYKLVDKIFSKSFTIKASMWIFGLIADGLQHLVSYNSSFVENTNIIEESEHALFTQIEVTRLIELFRSDPVKELFKRIKWTFGKDRIIPIEYADALTQVQQNMDQGQYSSLEYFSRILNKIIESYEHFGSDNSKLAELIKKLFETYVNLFFSFRFLKYGSYILIHELILSRLLGLYDKLKYIPGGTYYEQHFNNWKSLQTIHKSL